MGRWFVASEPEFHRRFDAFLAEKREADHSLGSQVAEIIARVRAEGDAALRHYCETLDGFTPPESSEGNGLAVSPAQIRKAMEECPPPQLEALRLAAARIEACHRRQLPADAWVEDEAGVGLGHRWTPLASVGLYVPGGTAVYPSSVLMNAIPARIAGVERIVMVAPTPGGRIAPLLLAAAHIAGVSEIYRLGGAQAIAALAYGSESIAPVDKIVGPGNAWVAEAKRQVFGICGIDSIAGPSEIVVLADRDANPQWVAADLLSQAEHDKSSRSVLIADDSAFAEAVVAELERQLEALPRADIARASWRDFGAVMLVDSLEGEGVALVDRLAPEHLEIAVSPPARADELTRRIRNAGAIFLGAHTPETVGDYVAGNNHVLPTNGSARFASGLSVLDFVKRTSLLRCAQNSLLRIGPAAIVLAEAEGLHAHAEAVRLRLEAAEERP